MRASFTSLRRPQALANSRITHIVSVVDWPLADDSPLLQGYRHLHVAVTDVEDENLIEWFPRSNAFIHHALGRGAGVAPPPAGPEPHPSETRQPNGVLVHWSVPSPCFPPLEAPFGEALRPPRVGRSPGHVERAWHWPRFRVSAVGSHAEATPDVGDAEAPSGPHVPLGPSCLPCHAD